MSDSIRIPFDTLVARLAAILETNGCVPWVAQVIGLNCASAQRDGAHSHGVFRMKGYVSTLNAGGWVDGRAEPLLEDVAPGFLRVDGMNGFTVPALARARDAALAKVKANGCAVLAIRNSHHLGALSLDVEPFADEGLIALSFINSMASVVPHGGRKAALGTNPIAFATPRRDARPLVFDMATSVMAHGDVQLAAREGRTLDEGVGVDRDGKPTTDPKAVVDGGALMAFGGHKGAALALMVEVMCGALVGGKLSREVDLKQHPGAHTPHTGQSFILIDPQAGRGALPPFVDRVEDLMGYLTDAGQTRLPGDRRHKARDDSMKNGVPVSTELVAMLEEMERG